MKWHFVKVEGEEVIEMMARAESDDGMVIGDAYDAVPVARHGRACHSKWGIPDLRHY